MSPWKEAALNAYYWATSPWRWWRNVLAVWSERVPIAVVMYHRVADDAATPWTVSTRMFHRQVRWLAERFELVSLEEAQHRIRKGANFQPTVAITFDDGYAENCRQAIPLLVKYRVPCTYFVTVHNILTGEPFTHDLLRGVSAPPNTVEQLRAMAEAGIEIGSHGYSHADLGQIGDPRLLEHEVVNSRRDLERALGRPVRYFAFPFGHYDNLTRAAFAAAERAGYEAVCSAYGGLNFPGDDGFHLQRMGIDDDMIGLKNWITGDPRRMFTARFVYERGEGPVATCPSTFRRAKPPETPASAPAPSRPALPAAPSPGGVLDLTTPRCSDEG